MRHLPILTVAVVGQVLVASTPRQQSQPLVPRPVLKLIVDHPALAPYPHPERVGRVPLVVSDHLLEPGVTPSKFGRPLQIVPDREVGTRPHLRILSFEVDGSQAKAVVEYRVESVQAVFDLRRDAKGWWTIVDAKVVEHQRRRPCATDAALRPVPLAAVAVIPVDGQLAIKA